MWFTLRLDKEGRVAGVGGPGARSRGAAARARCEDVVGARDASGRRWCTERCALALLAGGPSERTLAWGRLGGDGVPVQLTCMRLGGEVVVVAERTASPTPTQALSGRERQVLDALSRGRTVAEAAAELGVTPGTARTHVERLRRKLGARSVAEAVARARE